ncbi:hypothetical protein HUJ04_010736 [Dendroctonus ponderosae]|nr:hypothetical protein HUJ04_010736 [Dendroctonus ponderosae]
MVICEADEKKHRSGVNALQFDPQLDRLYSAGRDSIIRVHEHEKFIHGMEHHTDWVNDIVLCCGGRHCHTETVKALVVSRDGTQCISGSSDGSIKIWNIGQQRCIQTILLHTEAVWALLATENFTYLISGGRDKKVIMTDLKNVQNSVLVCTEEAPVLKMCFTADQQGIWVSTSDSTVRCWKLPSEKHFSDDIPLSRQPISVIPGDASTVKATILNDKRHILTKDFNGNVFLYDVLRAIKVESLGPVNYQNEINARNSGKLLYVPNWFTTDLKTGMLTIHLGQDEVDCFAAWVSAKDAGIDHPEPDHKVNYGKLLLHALFEHYRGLQPDQESRLHFTMLTIHLGQDEVDCFAAWVSAKDAGIDHPEPDHKVNYGKLLLHALFEHYRGLQPDQESRLHFTMLTIHLGQDEVDCFAAWVSAKDAGIDHPEPDHKVNYGKLLLHALFEHYRGLQPDQESRLHFTVPKYIPLILSEIGGRTLYRVLVGDTPGETETALLNETVPTWVISNIEDNCTTKFTKVQFYLKPHSCVPANLLKPDRLKKTDRLVANDFIQCRKVAEHVLEKLLGEGTISSPGGEGDAQNQFNSGYTVDQIILLCSDQPVDLSMDLRTVKHYMWKYSSDLVLHYKILSK